MSVKEIKDVENENSAQNVLADKVAHDYVNESVDSLNEEFSSVPVTGFCSDAEADQVQNKIVSFFTDMFYGVDIH